MKNCWKLCGICGVLMVVLFFMLMLIIEGIIFLSIGVRFGICWVVVVEEVLVVVVESGDNVKFKFRVSVLSVNVVFFMYFSFD